MTAPTSNPSTLAAGRDQSPAATIRDAITLLLDTAAAVPPGPWEHVRFTPTADRSPATHAVRAVPEPPYTVGVLLFTGERYTRAAAVCEFIALMGPPVAEALADWLEAELAAHEQAGALAAAATSGELHIGGDLARVEVGLSTLDKAHAVALAVTWHDRNRTGTATPTDTEPKD